MIGMSEGCLMKYQVWQSREKSLSLSRWHFAETSAEQSRVQPSCLSLVWMYIIRWRPWRASLTNQERQGWPCMSAKSTVEPEADVSCFWDVYLPLALFWTSWSWSVYFLTPPGQMFFTACSKTCRSSGPTSPIILKWSISVGLTISRLTLETGLLRLNTIVDLSFTFRETSRAVRTLTQFQN